MNIEIRRAVPADRGALLPLRAALWPEAGVEEHSRELAYLLESGLSGTLPGAVFIAETETGAPAGFIETGLRSHAEGCDPARPAGYIEGWYVGEEFRRQRIGARLVAAAEDWARGHGCTEMASDAFLENELSLRAHEALGYGVVERSIRFRKRL